MESPKLSMISKTPDYHTQDSAFNRLGLREKSISDAVAAAALRAVAR
jgi:hypothetical protein